MEPLASHAARRNRPVAGGLPVLTSALPFAGVGALVSAIPRAWAWQNPAGRLLGMLCVLGVLAIMGQMGLTKGYSLAPAGQLGPFTCGNVVSAHFWAG